MIEVAQLRAARALVGWSQDRLAVESGVSKPTIARLELGSSGAVGGYAGTRDKLRVALEAAGVIFVEENGEGPGVRLRKPVPAGDHPKHVGPASDAVERMEAEIAADRGKRRR